MSIDLTLYVWMGVVGDHPAAITTLRLDEGGRLSRQSIPWLKLGDTKPVPRGHLPVFDVPSGGFGCYELRVKLSSRENDEVTSYGDVKTDAYDSPLKWARAADILTWMKRAKFGGPRDFPANRAAVAYLGALDPNHHVTLYWN